MNVLRGLICVIALSAATVRCGSSSDDPTPADAAPTDAAAPDTAQPDTATDAPVANVDWCLRENAFTKMCEATCQSAQSSAAGDTTCSTPFQTAGMKDPAVTKAMQTCLEGCVSMADGGCSEHYDCDCVAGCLTTAGEIGDAYNVFATCIVDKIEADCE